MLGCRERTFHVAGHHYALVHCTGLEPARRRPTRCGSTASWSGREPDTPYPPSVVRTHRRATSRSGSPGAPAASARRTSRRTRCPRTSTPTGARSTRCACSPSTCARGRPGDVAARARAARRPGLRRRGLARGARVHPLAPRPRGAAGRDRRELRGVHAALPRRRGRSRTSAGCSPTVPLGDDLRRPRRPRRLEHVARLGRGDARRPAGGTSASSAASRRYWLYQHMGNLSPAAPGRGRRSTRGCARPTTAGRSCASSRSAPTARSPARAGATAATSAARGWS